MTTAEKEKEKNGIRPDRVHPGLSHTPHTHNTRKRRKTFRGTHSKSTVAHACTKTFVSGRSSQYGYKVIYIPPHAAAPPPIRSTGISPCAHLQKSPSIFNRIPSIVSLTLSAPLFFTPNGFLQNTARISPLTETNACQHCRSPCPPCRPTVARPGPPTMGGQQKA